MIRILIIASGMAARAGLRALLSEEPRLQIMAEAASLTEIDVSLQDVDVVVWSPAPYLDQDSFRSELSNLKIGENGSILLIHDDPQVIGQLAHLPVRAWGVLDTEATQSELVAGILALYEGLAIANPSWLKQSITNHTASSGKEGQLIEPLTERELEILQLLALGLTNKQIAARLKISAHTVKFHVSSIFTKLGTTNRVETVNIGLKNGWIVL